MNAETDPVFIVGVMRSGTTLLRLMLTSHPDICIPPEAPFFVRLHKKYRRAGDLSARVDEFLEDLFRVSKFADWNLDRDRLKIDMSRKSPLIYADAIRIVYHCYVEQTKPSAKIWGDKTPDNLRHLKQIWKSFPEARVLHVIRDPRAIYNSMLALQRNEDSRKSWSHLSVPLYDLCDRWKSSADIVKQSASNAAVYHLLYENLVQDPEVELRKICNWLRITFDPEMLNYHAENLQRKLVPTERMKWHQNTANPVLKERINSWKNTLTSAEVQAVEVLMGREMKDLGYECESPVIPYRGWIKCFSEFMKLAVVKLRAA